MSISSTIVNRNHQVMEKSQKTSKISKRVILKTNDVKRHIESKVDGYDNNGDEKKENVIGSVRQTSFEMIDELSEYEILRERNIEKRRSLFQELNLNQARDYLHIMLPSRFGILGIFLYSSGF